MPQIPEGTRLLDLIAAALHEDQLTVASCANLLGVSTTTARRHLKTLVADGRAGETTVNRGGNRGGATFSLFYAKWPANQETAAS